MNLTVTNNFEQRQKTAYKPTFKGPLDGVLTSTLRTLDSNEMANAVILDVGAMVTPRTYIDTKKRNKYAGAETFIREISGTFINCLSAGLLGVAISHITANLLDTDTIVNPNSWFSDDAIKVLKGAWDKSENKTEKYVENIFENMSGKDGIKVVEFKNIDWKNVPWFDENKWEKYVWNNDEYKNTARNLKTKDGIIKTFAKIIDDKNIDKNDKKQILKIMETRITNALGVSKNVDVKIGGNKLTATLEHILRDTFDMGFDVFKNENVNIDSALAKIQKINKIKIFGALSLASVLGLTNQRLNRKLTEKRTGKKGFVGDKQFSDKNLKVVQKKSEDKKGLVWKKILASAGMLAMTIGVMRIKNPKDFVKKLQFTGPVSTGNAIKTVYASTIIGRFLAADNNKELRESATRDYLGFLNWLVFGGFVSKGVANLLDKNRKNLFNETKSGQGIRHWLNDIVLKTHTEIVAKGKEFAKKNLWKLNASHIAGLAYSTIALGILLPLLNIKVSSKNDKAKV